MAGIPRYIGFNLAPGGCIVHVYDQDTHELLRETGAVPGPDEAQIVVEDVLAICRDFAGRRIQIMVYDGNTGEAMKLRQ